MSFNTKNFKFKASLLIDEECPAIIQKAWVEGGRGSTRLQNA
jgi:hypothetical protein